MKTYYPQIEMHNHERDLLIAQITYEMWNAVADYLGITLEEYIAFMQDMEMQEEECYSLEDIEQMYVEYCQEYDIPHLQIDNPMHLYGAI